MNNRKCDNCGFSELECDCENPNIVDEININEMKRKHPGHNDDAYSAGRMLGVDFPYVPGDPFW